MEIFPNLGQNLGKSILNKKPATPYKIRIYRQCVFTSFSFPQVSTLFSLCSCKFLFCSPPLHINKNVRKNTTIYPLHSYTFPSKNQLLHSLKKLLLPSHPPLPLSITFLSTFILTKCRKSPFYKALTEKMKHKTDEKEDEDILYVYTQKEVWKPLLYLPLKNWKCPFYKALKKKRKHKNGEKGRGG